MNKKTLMIVGAVGLAYLLYKRSKGTPVNGVGDLLGAVSDDLADLGKFSVKRAFHSTATMASAPLKMTTAVVKVAAAPFIAAKVAVQGGSPQDVKRAFVSSSLAPMTTAAKLARGVAPASMTGRVDRLVDRTVNTGRPARRTSAGIVTPAAPDNSGQLDINGYPVGSLYQDQNGNPITAQQYYDAVHASSPAPDTSSVPSVPDSSSQSYSTQQQYIQPTPIIDQSQLYPQPMTGGGPTDTYNYTAPPAAAPDQAPIQQQYQMPDAPPVAAAGKINPLVAIGTLLAVPAIFMLTGKK